VQNAVWPRRAALAALLLVGTCVVVATALVGPYVQDDHTLDQVVRAVALDWRDFGLETAQTRLQHELDRQRIGLQVSDGDCAFQEVEGGTRVVHCAWEVEVRVPLLSRGIPMSFRSEARVEPDGHLR
jgi:hypothetical protein